MLIHLLFTELQHTLWVVIKLSLSEGCLGSNFVSVRWFELNNDGRFNMQEKEGGAGRVIRDRSENVL